MQSVAELNSVQVEAILSGPITLGCAPSNARVIASSTSPLDPLVWAANDTTGEQDGATSRKGGRASFCWTSAEFSGNGCSCDL
jgi:hypothetical protein